MLELYNTIFYQPLFNLLVFFYNIIPGHDIGAAIILVTIVLKLILYPLSSKSLKSQKALQELQPQIDELKEKYKDDKQQMSQAMMKLYQQEKINPFSSCLPLLIQLPFLIAVYRVFIDIGNSVDFSMLYSFVSDPGEINHVAFGFLNLAQASIYLAVLAGIAQFFQGRMLTAKKPPVKNIPGSKDESMTATMNKQMTYFMPLLTVFIGSTLPAGLTLYWLVTTVITLIQQKIFLKD